MLPTRHRNVEKSNEKRPSIMIVGGYGHVGSQIALRLIHSGCFNVFIAGRDRSKASAKAASLMCNAAFIDLTKPLSWDPALNGIDAVIVCMDQPDTGFVKHVLQSGRHYLDITADDHFFRKVEEFTTITNNSGAVALLSIGLAPGLTNLLVKAGAENLDIISEARIGILLGLGDEHGPAAIDWTLRNFKSTSVENLKFDNTDKYYPAIQFNFADQHVLRRTLNINNIKTLMTFDKPVLSRMLFCILPIITRLPILRKLTSKSMTLVRLGTDRAVLSVEVKGSKNGNQHIHIYRLEGRQEAAITALVAAETIKMLFEKTIPSGIWHIDQIFSINDYKKQLIAEGVILEIINGST